MQRISPSIGPAKIDEIRATFAGERKARLADLLGPDNRLLPVVWIGIALSCLQQFVGINVIFYYGTTLWEAVGFSDADSLRINVISSTINIVATVIAISLIDRIGRRPLLLWGAVGMAVTLGVLALMFATASHRRRRQGGTLPWQRPDRVVSPPTCTCWRSACRGDRRCGRC